MESFCFDDKSYISKNVNFTQFIIMLKIFVSTMTIFNPKMIVLENDNVSMAMFKEMVNDKIFGIRTSKNDNHSFFSGNTKSAHEHLHEKLKFYTFTGMEICDDEELSILENNTYLFVS